MPLWPHSTCLEDRRTGGREAASCSRALPEINCPPCDLGPIPVEARGLPVHGHCLGAHFQVRTNEVRDPRRDVALLTCSRSAGRLEMAP